MKTTIVFEVASCLQCNGLQEMGKLFILNSLVDVNPLAVYWSIVVWQLRSFSIAYTLLGFQLFSQFSGGF